jgi:hypothetical protein
LVIAPKFKKKRVQVFVKGQRANDIVKSKKLLAQAYQFIRNDYNKYMPKTSIRIAKLFGDAGIVGAAKSAELAIH